MIFKRETKFMFFKKKKTQPVYSYKNQFHFFPQATDFSPHLFESTHKTIHTVSKTGILSVELLFKTLNKTLNYIGATSSRNIYIWGKDKTYARQFGRFDKLFFFEHGWLPRSSYQMSPDGINFSAHFAKWKYDPSKKTDPDINPVINNLRKLYFPPEKTESIIKEDYIIFPFQMSNDFNLKYAGEPFSSYFSRDKSQISKYLQFCIDYISDFNLDMPVVFKQHPMDTQDASRLKLRRKQDRFILNSDNVSLGALLNKARGLVTVNSNSLHEALVLNVPVKVLGNFLADISEYHNIFGNLLTPFIQNPLKNIKIHQYLRHVLSNQWYLSDFNNPLMVMELITNSGYICPAKLRKKCRLIP